MNRSILVLALMTLLASCKFPESMAWVVSTFAGTGTAGSVDGYSTAQFKNPYGVAVDSSGYVYVADSDNHCIRKITPEGVVSTFAGSRTEGFKDGTGIEAQFNSPRGVVVNSSGNVVYVADTNNHRIRKITPADRIEDRVVTTFAGSGTAGSEDATASTAVWLWTHPALSMWQIVPTTASGRSRRRGW